MTVEYMGLQKLPYIRTGGDSNTSDEQLFVNTFNAYLYFKKMNLDPHLTRISVYLITMNY